MEFYYKKNSKNRIYALDSLKGIMIFSIVLFHLPEWLHGFPNILSFAYNKGGDYGNAFFFMVSGFTLSLTYSERIQQIAFKDFLKKRVLKVYVLYIVTDIAQMIFEIVTKGIEVINIRDIILNLTMTTSGWIENIYPYNIATWFFSVLLLDYILFFIISKYGKNNKYYLYIIALIIGMIIQKTNLNYPFLYYHNGEAYTPFFIGCLLSKALIDSKKHIKLIFPLTALTICFIILTAFNGFDKAAGTWKYVWYFVVCPMIILVSIDVKIINKILSLKPVVFCLGGISTYIFFWHGPFMNYFVYLKIKSLMGLSTDGFILFYLPVLIIFCNLYKFFEQKISNWFQTCKNQKAIEME